MSAPSKSNTPMPATTTQSKDWMKAVTLELNAGTDDETEVIMVKQGELKQHKQARLAEQERQCQKQEEREHKMVEARDPGLPKKESVQKGLVIDNSGEGFDSE